MRNDARMAAALLDHGADPDLRLRTWTPTRRASRDLHYPPPFVGATPFWLAARFARTDLMRLLADHGADPHFQHEVDYIVDGRMKRRTDRTTTLMAATGMGGGQVRPWAPYSGDGTAESRTLDAVRLAVELGVDVNAVDAAGRTVLDEAEALQYETVVRYLVEQGRAARGELAGGTLAGIAVRQAPVAAQDDAPPVASTARCRVSYGIARIRRARASSAAASLPRFVARSSPAYSSRVSASRTSSGASARSTTGRARS